MNLEKILEMWSEDCKIDDVMLDESSIKIPQLHSKYIALHSQFKLLLEKSQQEKRKVYHFKKLYYSGKDIESAYENAPLEHKILKSDVPHWVEVDEMYLKVEEKIANYETILSTLSDILKQINQMNFNISNAVKWRIFASGG